VFINKHNMKMSRTSVKATSSTASCSKKATRRYALDTTTNRNEPEGIQSIIKKLVAPIKEIPPDFDRKNFIRKMRSRRRSFDRRPNVLFCADDFLNKQEVDEDSTTSHESNESPPIQFDAKLSMSDDRLENMMGKIRM
jgi:hypothetical protein